MRWTGAFPAHGIVSVHTEEDDELTKDAIDFQPLQRNSDHAAVSSTLNPRASKRFVSRTAARVAS